MNASATMNSAFLDALFKLFDRDNSGTIDFGEFVLALAIYQNKARAIPEEDKQKVFFKLYDIDGDGEISSKDLATILTACFSATHMNVQPDDVDALVRATFAKYTLTPRGTIDFTSYSKSAFRLA
jgi:Ca2+-binding EF-hand superfamily protein